MSFWEIFINILQILISWPIVIFILVLFIIKKFKDPITCFLQGVEEFEALGVKAKVKAQTEIKTKKDSKDLNKFEKQIQDDPTSAAKMMLNFWLSAKFERIFNLWYTN